MEFYMECTFTSPMSLIPDRPPDMDLKKNNSVPKSAARRTLSSLSRCLPKLCMQLLFSTVGKPAGAAAFAIASVIQSPRRSFPDLTHDTTKPAASQVYTSNHLSLSLSLSHTHTHTHTHIASVHQTEEGNIFGCYSGTGTVNRKQTDTKTEDAFFFVDKVLKKNGEVEIKPATLFFPDTYMDTRDLDCTWSLRKDFQLGFDGNPKKVLLYFNSYLDFDQKFRRQRDQLRKRRCVFILACFLFSCDTTASSAYCCLPIKLIRSIILHIQAFLYKRNLGSPSRVLPRRGFNRYGSPLCLRTALIVQSASQLITRY